LKLAVSTQQSALQPEQRQLAKITAAADKGITANSGPKGPMKTTSTALSQDSGWYFSLLFSTKRFRSRGGVKNERDSVEKSSWQLANDNYPNLRIQELSQTRVHPQGWRFLEIRGDFWRF
jgi:hypothetical protein